MRTFVAARGHARVGAELRSRDDSVDTARGITCVLVVAFHAIGSTPSAGLHIANESSWRLFADLLGYVRMPAFAFLSGYVYAQRPFSNDAGAFVIGKARRLLIPMLVVGTAFAFLQAVVPGTNG